MKFIPPPPDTGYTWFPEFRRWLSPRSTAIARNQSPTLTAAQCAVHRRIWRQLARTIELPPEICPRCGLPRPAGEPLTRP
jgi:hypothetical protein